MNGCCIIETRIIANLQEIIQEKHLKFIPKEWGLTLFLSEENRHLINEHKFDREVQIFFLPMNFQEYQYNHLLTSVSFWEKMMVYKNVLIFQTDSELLKEGIEGFCQYAFIGAPDERKGCEGMMNGGLSLRNVRLCANVCYTHKYDGSVNEDWWFCKLLPKALMPTFDQAKSFSVETKFHLGSLGYHAIDKHLLADECSEIRTQYYIR